MQLPKDVLREMKEVGSSYKHLPSATDQAWITRWLGLEDGAVAYRHYHQPDSARHRLVWIRSQVLIAMLGLMGGLLGAGCVLFNMYVCRLRSRYGWSGPTWRGRLYIAMVPCDRSHNVFVFFSSLPLESDQWRDRVQRTEIDKRDRSFPVLCWSSGATLFLFSL